ncbi:MAG: heme exporter protein CcmD [Alphaproteobacteria bacterium]|nr:heme exporter protein CcmD [Alphaproteobacteria bacterium]
MGGLLHWLAMGGYWPFVWPAYAVAAIVLGGLAAETVRRHRAARIRAAALERAGPVNS